MFAISKATLFEFNVIILIIGMVLFVDVYSHTSYKWEIEETLNLTNKYALATERYICMTRGVLIITHTVNAVLGIYTVKHDAVHIVPIYIIIMSLMLAYTFSIVMSTLLYADQFAYKIEVIVNRLWAENRMYGMEQYFDCCGRHGARDYVVVERMPSSLSCCQLENCNGCAKVFYKYMWELEKEGARDCAVLFVIQIIGIILIVLYMVGQPSPQDIPDDPE